MVTLEQVKEYLNIEKNDTYYNNQLSLLLEIALNYVANYTSLKIPNLEEQIQIDIIGIENVEQIYIDCYKELDLAILQIVSSSFNNRDYQSETKLNVNRFVKSILDMHRRNFC